MQYNHKVVGPQFQGKAFPSAGNKVILDKPQLVAIFLYLCFHS